MENKTIEQLKAEKAALTEKIESALREFTTNNPDVKLSVGISVLTCDGIDGRSVVLRHEVNVKTEII